MRRLHGASILDRRQRQWQGQQLGWAATTLPPSWQRCHHQKRHGSEATDTGEQQAHACTGCFPEQWRAQHRRAVFSPSQSVSY